jgi:hypothetical protein
MKTYHMHFKNSSTGLVDYSIISAKVEAENKIDALEKWYRHVKSLAGSFKTFLYEAVDPLPNSI